MKPAELNRFKPALRLGYCLQNQFCDGFEGRREEHPGISGQVRSYWIKGHLQDPEVFYSTLGFTLSGKNLSSVLLTSLGSQSSSLPCDRPHCTSASLQGLSIPTRLRAQERPQVGGLSAWHHALSLYLHLDAQKGTICKAQRNALLSAGAATRLLFLPRFILSTAIFRPLLL